MAKMPYVAFRLVGGTIVALWLAGIVFCICEITGTGIGWNNVISGGHALIEADNEAVERRLLSGGEYTEIPALFLDVDTVGCTRNGIMVEDSISDRKFLIDVSTELSEKTSVRKITERKFRIGTWNITGPIDYAKEFGDIHFVIAGDEIIGFSKNVASKILAWKKFDGKFDRAIPITCRTKSSGIVGVCGNQAVYNRGDSCSF